MCTEKYDILLMVHYNMYNLKELIMWGGFIRPPVQHTTIWSFGYHIIYGYLYTVHTICSLLLVNIWYITVLGKISCIAVHVLIEPPYTGKGIPLQRYKWYHESVTYPNMVFFISPDKRVLNLKYVLKDVIDVVPSGGP